MHADTVEDYERAEAQLRQIAARESNDLDDARGLLRSGGLRDHEPWPREVKATAAALRASVERGDPLAYFRDSSMRLCVHAGQGIAIPLAAPLAARADEAVADDPHGPDVPLGNLASEPDRLDGAAMEHERQSRLRKWQRLP